MARKNVLILHIKIKAVVITPNLIHKKMMLYELCVLKFLHIYNCKVTK